MYQEIILSKISEYCKKKKWGFKKYGKVFVLDCPICGNNLSARIINHTHKIRCLNPVCTKKTYTLVSVVKANEKDKKDMNKEDIIQYLKELLKVNVLTKKDEGEINNWLKVYKNNGWCLVPVAKNAKKCIEKEWSKREHRDIEDWERWIAVDGLNVGVRTGAVSNLTIIDLDLLTISEANELFNKKTPKPRRQELLKKKTIPNEIKSIMGDCLIQRSRKGFHLFYKYIEGLPKSSMELNGVHIDIENNGGQVVIYPSVTEDYSKRKFMNNNKVLEMPLALLKLIKANVKIPKRTYSERIIEDIESDYRNPLIKEGEGRNDLLVRLAGKFRKTLNLKNTEYAIKMLNSVICDPPLSGKELMGMMGSLETYNSFDEEDLTQEILDYLKNTDGALRIEIARGMKEDPKKVAKALAYLVKEDKIMKRGSYYSIQQKPEWKKSLINVCKPVNFKVPYFDDIAKFNWGDNIIIGASTGVGKCIASGYILTRDGLVDIEKYGEDYPEGITYLKNDTHLHYGRKDYFFKPKYFYKKKVNETIKIITSNGYELEGTPEHPILCIINKKEKFVKLQDISIETVKLSPGGFGSYDMPILNDFNYDISKSTYNTTKITLPIVMEKELAKFLGYFIADGNFVGQNIQISNQNKYVQDEICKILKRYNIDINMRKNKKGIIVSSATFIKFIKHLFDNVGNLTARNKFIPNSILCSKKEIQKAFLEGYLNCDSSLYRNTFEFLTASSKMAKQLHLMLLCFGIIAKKTPKIVKGYNHTYWRFILNAYNSKLILKTFKLSKYKNKIVPKTIQKDNEFIDKIKTKNTLNKPKFVYDFNIPTHHAFWSNGFVSHNTHIAVNILKKLVDQGIKPKYVGREPGSRFIEIALQLGLKEGDFEYIEYCPDPTKLEFEKNDVIIIDWLLPKDYAKTDKTFDLLTLQLQKCKGFMFTFVQLNKQDDWFAKNMVEFFPALSAKYLYDDPEDTLFGHFEIHKIRAGLRKKPKRSIPCRYDWETKLLIRIEDEINESATESNEELKDESVED